MQREKGRKKMTTGLVSRRILVHDLMRLLTRVGENASCNLGDGRGLSREGTAPGRPAHRGNARDCLRHGSLRGFESGR